MTLDKLNLNRDPNYEELEVPLRILRREWKKYKPHLPKSTSLPTLSLLPPKRPLFTCLRCGFSNTLIPLCLWCTWTSSEATYAFEMQAGLLARGRRISAPPRVSWKRKDDERSDDRKDREMRTEDSTASTLLTPLHDMPSKAPGKTNAGVASDRSDDHKSSALSCLEVERRSRDRPESASKVVCAEQNSLKRGTAVVRATLPSTEPEQKARLKSLDDMDDDDSSPALRARRRLSAIFLDSRPRTSYDSRKKPSVDRLSSINTNSNASRSPPVVVDLPVLHQHNTSSAPQRTLRRKKRMTILKQKSSCSLRTRSRGSASPPSAFDAKGSMSVNASMDKEKDITTSPRLGHPSRPYYTAIRKNMSRPSSPSPFDSTMPSRACTPSPPPAAPPMSSFAPTPRASAAFRHSFAAPSRPSSPGFSLSGETELHMALARWRSEDADPDGSVEEEYRFIVDDSAGGRGRGCGGVVGGCVKGKVRRLSKGLKDLVLGRR